MDSEIVALAASAGSTIVTLMATDVWLRTRSGIIALWRRVYPDRAEEIARELDDSRVEVMAAREAGDESVENEVCTEWQSRLRRLMQADPSVASDLSQLLNELDRHRASERVTNQHAVATGNSLIQQAGRDIHVGKVDRFRERG